MKKLKLFAFSLIAFLCFGVISVNAFSQTVITIDGLTYTDKTYDKTPIVPTGTNLVQVTNYISCSLSINIIDYFTIFFNGFILALNSNY